MERTGAQPWEKGGWKFLKDEVERWKVRVEDVIVFYLMFDVCLTRGTWF